MSYTVYHGLVLNFIFLIKASILDLPIDPKIACWSSFCQAENKSNIFIEFIIGHESYSDSHVT